MGSAPKPLTPPDRERCQALLPADNFMVIGGNYRRRRCENRPTTLIRNKTPGEDGLVGKMTLCDRCLVEARKQLGDTVVEHPVRPKRRCWGVFLVREDGCTLDHFPQVHFRSKKRAERTADEMAAGGKLALVSEWWP